MKKLTIIGLFLVLFLVIGCTKNQRAKNWGGSQKIELPCGMKLYDITWKQDNLWYDYIPMEKDYEPVDHTFKEKSSFGVMQGSVIFIEKKCN